MLGKVAIVTGSSNGIGRATAILLCSKGTKVVITGRNVDALSHTYQECLKVGGTTSKDILHLVGDLTDNRFIEELVEKTIQTFGRLDILINNAGQIMIDMTGKEGFDQPVEVLQSNMNLNVKAPMYLTQLCFPHLKKTGGAVVFTSSIMSLSPHANMSMPYYAICKAATDHLARSMALEYIKQGVRVNVVNPGLVSTTIFTKFGIPEDKIRKMEDYVSANPNWIPAGRVGQPEDVAKAIVFLADNSQSAYIVGQTLPVCGGASLCMGIDTSDYKTPMMEIIEKATCWELFCLCIRK